MWVESRWLQELQWLLFAWKAICGEEKPLKIIRNVQSLQYSSPFKAGSRRALLHPERDRLRQHSRLPCQQKQNVLPLLTLQQPALQPKETQNLHAHSCSPAESWCGSVAWQEHQGCSYSTHSPSLKGRAKPHMPSACYSGYGKQVSSWIRQLRGLT
ncbi:hypothetical protein SRHO_G00106710 [Serrasalmus rhombeus]